MAERAPREASAGRSETPRERRFRREVARWRSWRSSTGGWGLGARVIALADVTTPLVGARGAAPVFGPQKGAGPEGVKLLSRGLERLAELMARHGRADLATLPGGGAAGGRPGGAGGVCQGQGSG